jgi:hypothetical protein
MFTAHTNKSEGAIGSCHSLEVRGSLIVDVIDVLLYTHVVKLFGKEIVEMHVNDYTIHGLSK